MNWKTGCLIVLVSALLAGPVHAGGVVLVPSRDNTLYEPLLQAPEGEIPPSNGAGIYMFVGTTLIGPAIRRGVLAFDVDSVVPAGSVITEVTLTLEMSRTISDAWNVTLHRMLTDWGEGDSDATGQEGMGAPAEPGDATWFHSFFPGSLWASEGGDFSAVVSATQTVSGLGTYTWGSTEQMVADVQGWLDDPGANFGWLLMGNESFSPTAKRFNTRENSSGVPQLSITYQEPVPTAPLWFWFVFALTLTAIAWRMLPVGQGARS